MNMKAGKVICTILFLLAPFRVVVSSPSEDRKSLYRDAATRASKSAVHWKCPCDWGAIRSDGESSLSPEESHFRSGSTSCNKNIESLREDANSESGSVSRYTLPIWPYEGLPLPEGAVDLLLCRITCQKSSTTDFDLALWVRVLSLEQDEAAKNLLVAKTQEIYDQGELPLWLQKGEKHRIYSSENHQILWMSAAHILEPYLDMDTYPYTGHDTLRKRLLHLLNLKISFGYYEFFSTQYHRFTLGALLNLVDFSTDAQVQSKAELCVDRLIGDWMVVTNSLGSAYPAAGRNYDILYQKQQWLSMMWMALGLSDFDGNKWRGDFAGSFLATSSYDLERVANKWSPVENRVLSFGHPVDQHQNIHSSLENRVDQILFQWSAGGYAMPETIEDTVWLLAEYDLYLNREFEPFATLFQTVPELDSLSRLLPGQSRGTDLSRVDVHVYKHTNVALTSLANYLASARSGQQFPWIASLNNVAVYTQAGVTGPCVATSVTDMVANTHLPDVQQEGNVALITYRPSVEVKFVSQVLQDAIDFGGFDTRVALHFPVESFDEVIEHGQWICGRVGESYVAVYRAVFKRNDCSTVQGDPCEQYYYSDTSTPPYGQTWAAVVGNNVTHSSFQAFQNVVTQGIVREEVSITPLDASLGLTYSSSLEVDVVTLSVSLDGYTRAAGRASGGRTTSWNDPDGPPTGVPEDRCLELDACRRTDAGKIISYSMHRTVNFLGLFSWCRNICVRRTFVKFTKRFRRFQCGKCDGSTRTIGRSVLRGRDN